MIPQEVQQKRLPQHVKNVIEQCFQCAKRSQSESIRAFYAQKLREISGNRQLWSDLVYDVKIDETLTAFPKITPAADAPPPEPNRSNKRKAAAKGGPSNRTPI